MTNLALLENDDGHPEAALTELAEAERIDAARRTPEAVELLRDPAEAVTEHGDPDVTLGVIELLAYAASTLGNHEQALRLAACADEQRTISDTPLTDLDRTFLDRQLALSRKALDHAAASTDLQGRSLTIPEALAQAATLTTT